MDLSSCESVFLFEAPLLKESLVKLLNANLLMFSMDLSKIKIEISNYITKQISYCFFSVKGYEYNLWIYSNQKRMVMFPVTKLKKCSIDTLKIGLSSIQVPSHARRETFESEWDYKRFIADKELYFKLINSDTKINYEDESFHEDEYIKKGKSHQESFTKLYKDIKTVEQKVAEILEKHINPYIQIKGLSQMISNYYI